MNRDLQSYVEASHAIETENYAQLIRSALRESARLEPNVVEALEAQIESERKTPQEEAEKGRADDEQVGRLLYDNLSQENAARHDGRINAIRTDFAQKQSAIRQDCRRKREHIKQSILALEKKAKKEYEESQLMADFVNEGALAKTRESQTQTKFAARSDREVLDQVEADMIHLLGRWHASRGSIYNLGVSPGCPPIRRQRAGSLQPSALPSQGSWPWPSGRRRSNG